MKNEFAQKLINVQDSIIIGGTFKVIRHIHDWAPPMPNSTVQEKLSSSKAIN